MTTARCQQRESERVASVVRLPETPVARRLRTFLVALNSGDRDSLQQAIASGFAADTRGDVVSTARAWHNDYVRSGGYTIAAVDSATPSRIVVRARAGNDLSMRITLQVDSTEAHRITRLEVQPAAMPVPSNGRRLAMRIGLDSLQEFCRRMARENLFSGEVLVGTDSAILFEHAYGLADRDRKSPNTVATRFNLASLGKSFTSVAIAQFVQQNRLSYDSKLGAILPAFNESARSTITVHQLLTHRAGLGDYFGTPAYTRSRTNLNTVGDYLAMFANEPLQFAPGTAVRYSNNAFVVLGAIIEHLSGASFYDHLRQVVFERSGMRNTSYLPLDSVHLASAAVGYTLREGATDTASWPDGRRANTNFLPARGGPAGGVYSTGRDLLSFARALLRHSLLSEALTDRITTVTPDQPTGQGLLAREGYGFFDERFGSTRIISNNGGQAGVNTQLDIYPDQRLVVVVLSNYDGPAAVAIALKARGLFAR